MGNPPEDGVKPPGLSLWSAAAAAACVVNVLAAFTYFLVGQMPGHENAYGLGLFVGVPLLLGAIAAGTYREGHRTWPAIKAGWAALLLAILMVLILAIEGFVCVVMAAPILLGASALGACSASATKRYIADRRSRNKVAVSFLVLAPIFLYMDARTPRHPAHFTVETKVVISASPQKVWNELHNFDLTSEPDFWLFRHGVAFPLSSHTAGTGLSAQRICRLSTGNMTEVVDGWEPNLRLHFKVLSTPDCMTETTPYGKIKTPHLQGYYVSDAGEFRIRQLSDGKVELTGTSWYHLSLYPAAYWQLWSDSIVHQVHLRVMDDIKRRAESR